MQKQRRPQKTKTIVPSARRITLFNSLSNKKKILVVDDDPIVGDVFKIIFEEAGYDAELQRDGSELLNNNFPTLTFS